MASRGRNSRRVAVALAVAALLAGVCAAVQLVAAAPASAAATVPAPAGSWPFSEGSGTTTADSSGNGHTGTLGSGVTWAAPEVGAHSLALNGASTANVTISGAVVNTAASFTASAWVNLTSISSGGSLYETMVTINGLPTLTSTTVDGMYLTYQQSTDRFELAMRASDSTAGSLTTASSTAAVVAGVWYHVVGVYSLAAQTLSLYVNGALQGTPTAFTTPWQATGNTIIGDDNYGGTTYDEVVGEIDDVALYSSALTAAQVAALNQPQISAGYGHSCEIRSGNAYCWGINANGELGNNSTVGSSVPVPVYTGGALAGLTLTQISAGANATCALSSAGAAYCWGVGNNGQLGNNAIPAQSDVPVAVYTGGVLSGVTLTQISAGFDAACALSSAGAAYCWGYGTLGQLGNGLGTNTDAPVLVSGGLTLTQVDAGVLFTCGLTSAGAAYCWGDDTYGELGNSSTTQSNSPVAVTTTGTPLAGVTLTQISAGDVSACALSSAGAAYCWGSGSSGELGNGSTTATQSTAVAVTTTGVLSGVTLAQVNVGNFFTCALSTAGAAYCWGIGNNGDLGNNSVAGSLVPVAVYTSGVLSGVTLTQVSPGLGGKFACALDTFGAAYCWGVNGNGQAGNSSVANLVVPGAVAAPQPTMIAAGNIHSCEISSGKAYCWGDNSNGELGNNSTMNSNVPVAVSTAGVLSGVTLTQIATGTNFSCALSIAGAVYCWGLGTSGQLGNSSTTSSNVPVVVYTGGALSGVTLSQITANGATACALSIAGAAYCWGAGGSGQLGNGSTTTAQSTPVAVTTSGALSGVILIQAVTGGTSTCALSTAGAAYCWGAGGSGQLGNGSTTTAQSTPVAVTTSGVLTGVALAEITVGSSFACALSVTGTAYCWGLGTSGQLGNSASLSSSTAVAVTTSGVLSGVTLAQIDSGSNSSCALSAAGLGYCWGVGTNGQLGNGSTTAIQNAAVAVTATGVLTGQTLSQITVGTIFACALGNTSADSCWGTNVNAQLGNPDVGANFLLPVAVMAQPTMIASGFSHSCLLRNGKAYCWGDDTYGELGNNTTTTTPQSSPVPVYTGGVLSGLTLVQIAAGEDWTCALASTGSAYCWGNNSIALAGDTIDLGNNTNTASSVPVLVSGGLTFGQISVGADFACGLTSTGVAYCWGNNQSDQMGNGTTTANIVPGAVTATSGSKLYQLALTQIDAGTGYACALAYTGAAYCWGLGTSGQLGNGASTTSGTAVAVTVSGVLSGVDLDEIATGGTTACALSTAGTAYCWGAGSSGQLGNGSATGIQNTAVTVSATSTGMPLAQITAGTSFACAVDVTGAAYCWGLGTPSDQLGNNLNASSSTPVAVTATGVLAGASLFQISSGQLATCTVDTTDAFYCWGTNTRGQLGNASTTSSDVPVVVTGIAPGPPTGVSATPGDTTATISWTAPASLGTGTLTGYTATATAVSGTFTCTTTSAVTCVITGLTDGTTYSVTVITQTTDGNSVPSSPAVNVEPVGFLQLISPTSLTWAATGAGLNQAAVDGNSGDQQLTATDNTETGAGWHITVSATTFTTGPKSLPNTGAVAFTGSVTSSAASTAPTATCVGSCTLPTDTTTYPVVMATAVSSPTTYTVYDTAVSTGEGVMTIGGGSAANPCGWWVHVPAAAYAGVYTSTVTLAVVSAP